MVILLLFISYRLLPLLGCFSHVQLCTMLWNVARQAPLSMGFSRQEYWSGLHVLLQGIFPTQGLNPGVLNCRQIPYHWATREAQIIGYIPFISVRFTINAHMCIHTHFFFLESQWLHTYQHTTKVTIVSTYKEPISL